MKTFAKIKFYYGAGVISFIAAGIMVPLMLIRPHKSSDILHFWNVIIMRLIGGKIVTHGTQDSSVDMFVSNHQGIIDIIALEAEQNTNIQWVAKRELFDAPWFGYLLKLPRMINIDRDDRSGLVKLLRDIKETTSSDTKRVVAIFPEGTRSDAQELKEFKAGTKLISEKLELTIQPVIITNSKKLLNEHNKTAHSAEVHINYLEPFKVSKANTGWYEELRNKMQNAIDQEYTQYQRER